MFATVASVMTTKKIIPLRDDQLVIDIYRSAKALTVTEHEVCEPPPRPWAAAGAIFTPVHERAYNGKGDYEDVEYGLRNPCICVT